MLETLTINGVRGIDHLHLEGLSLVNVIAGDNGTGKTTILEAAVLIFGANPVELRRAQVSRGIPAARNTRQSLRGLNESLFPDFSNAGTAVISGTSSGQRWETRLFTSTQASASLPSLLQDVSEDEEEEVLVLRAETAINGRYFAPEHAQQEVRSELLSTTDRRPTEEDGRTLGDMRLSGSGRKQETIVDAMRGIRSDVEDVEYISSSTGAGFYARIGHRRYVPLGALGGGANALFRYLVALQKVAGGVLAIDEVEGGFYYKRVEAVFKALLVAARLTNTQIFCTTHSKEVLAALVNAANNLPGDDLSVVSVYRDDDGRVAAQVLRERDAFNSLKYGYELR